MDLVSLNVWMDVVFTALWIVVVAVLALHFAFDIITGRFRKKFFEGQWPEHDHLIPAMPKVLHFVHMVCILLLILSGMYIRFPFFDGGRTPMRYIHYVAMIIVTVVLVWRVWYAFLSRARDWREFAIGRKDIASLIGVVKFYAFLSDDKPHVAKYNVMQKMVYQLFFYFMIIQAFTGFALVTNPFIFGYSPRDILVGWWLGALLGSTDLAGWWARMIHYVLNWLFIIMLTAHVYLSVMVDIPCTLDFFGIKPLEIKDGHHHDEGGSEHHHPMPEKAPTY